MPPRTHRRTLFLFMNAAVAICFAATIARGQQAASESLVIEGGTLIDGTGAPARPIAALIVEGNRIKEIVPQGHAYQAPAGTRVIRGAGMSIMPGLIDSHLHSRDYDSELLISHGVTSIMDAGNFTDWISAQREGTEKGKIFGPRRFFAGVVIGAAKGQASINHRVELRDSEDAKKAALDMIALKSDFIKAYVAITPPELKVVVQEAHKAGLNVMGHIAATDAREAAEAGIDALAHMTGVLQAVAPADYRAKNGELLASSLSLLADFPVDTDKLTELAKFLVDKKVKIEPDLATVGKGLYKQWPQFNFEIVQLLSDYNLQYVPDDARHRWIFGIIPMSVSGTPAVLPPDGVVKPNSPEEQYAKRLELAKRNFGYLETFLKKFVGFGGEIIAADDAQHYAIPGLSMQQELQLLVEDIGLTPIQAIVSATRNPARFIHKDKDLGTLEVGKLADFLLVRGDPLQDIRRIRNLDAVVKDGKVMQMGYHASFQNPIPRYEHTEGGGGNPLPAIESLNPWMVTQGQGDLNLTISGARFVPGCVVTFKGRRVPMISQTRNSLTVKLSAADLEEVGTFPVVAINPVPEGGESAASFLIVKFR